MIIKHKIRPLSELFIIIRENTHQITNGFCLLCNELYWQHIISIEEFNYLNGLFGKLPKKYKGDYFKDKLVYAFPQGDIKSRNIWLDRQIENFKILENEKQELSTSKQKA